MVVLCQEHAAYEKAHYNPNGKRVQLAYHLFSDSPSLQCLVLERRGSVVGYATFVKQFSTWEADYYLYLDCLYLEKSVRGQGWGARLMEKVEEYARAEGYSTVQWQTPSFNKAAIDFYDKIGARAKSKERFYWDIQ